ncbi:MAG: SDR family NAD(P)-dependent oxidoreductase [Actinomycetota bacterium]
MRFLVTGAAGFIGSHLCRRLLAEGNEVVGLDDLSDGSLENLADIPEVRFMEADLRDEAAVRRAAKGSSTILHHGAMRSVPRSIAQPERTTDVNVRGTLNVLLAAREVGATVVFASSSSVYGDQETFPLREDFGPLPRSPYAASKLAGEAYCRTWWLSFGVPTVSLRYFNVYGPGQDPTNEYAAVIPRFILACLTGSQPEVHGDGEQSRDFTFIEDVVEANLLAARAPEDALGRVLNVGGGQEPTSVNRILKIVAQLTGATPEPMHTPPREGDVRRTEADVSLTCRLIGYEPKVEIEEGLRRTVQGFRSASGHSSLFRPPLERREGLWQPRPEWSETG